MNRRLYEIQIRSVREALDHLQVIHLEELEVSAREYGSAAELAMIAALRRWRESLPPDR
jgi:hypothetical protein